MTDSGSVPWLATMSSLDGTKWAPGDGKSSAIQSWLNFIGTAYPGMKPYCDSAASEDYFSWCGLTVGYCMAKAGIAPIFGASDTSRFLWAAAWMGWGTAVSNPQPGDVVIFDFGSNDHHVTLFVKDNGNGIWSCHGGNQGHEVKVSNFHKSNVMGIRRPIPAVQGTDIPLAPSIPAVATASASQDFNACVLLVLHDEGGNDDDPDDPGGRTSRGITQSDWNAWLKTHPNLPADVFQAPQEQIVAIYQAMYWNKLSCDALPSGVDYVVFDYGVLSGIGQSARVLQGYVGAAVDGEIGPQTIAAAAKANYPTLINQISDERIAHMKQSPVWWKYGNGWTARVQRVRAAALAMASAAASASVASANAAASPQKQAAPPLPSLPPSPLSSPGVTHMTPDEVAQVILSMITALATQQGSQPALTAPAVATIVQTLTALLAAQKQGGTPQPALSADAIQSLLAALAKQLQQQGLPIQASMPASATGQTPASPPQTTGSSNQSVISKPSVQIGAAGLGIATLLQALGMIAPPFTTAASGTAATAISNAATTAATASMPLSSSPTLGTLATVIPLIIAGVGATSGWGSLFGIASSLIGAIGNAAKKSQ